MYVTYIAFTFSKTIPNDTHCTDFPYHIYRPHIKDKFLHISCSCKAKFGPLSITLCIAQLFFTVKPCESSRFRIFHCFFDFTQFWLDGRPGNEYFCISHKISDLLTPLTPLIVHLQWFESLFKTDICDSSYCEWVTGSQWSVAECLIVYQLGIL